VVVAASASAASRQHPNRDLTGNLQVPSPAAAFLGGLHVASTSPSDSLNKWGGAANGASAVGASSRSGVRCRGLFDDFKGFLSGGGDKKKAEAAAEVASDASPPPPPAAKESLMAAATATAQAPPAPTKAPPAAAKEAWTPSTVWTPSSVPPPSNNSTMSALDAMLGTAAATAAAAEAEVAEEARQLKDFNNRKDAAEKKKTDAKASVSISPGALDALQQAERARKAAKDGDNSSAAGKDGKEGEGWMNNAVDRLSDSASKDREGRSEEENAKLDKVLKELSDLAKKDNASASTEEVKAKFESLFKILEIDNEPAVPKADVQRLKEEVFGYNTFYVTSTEELGPEVMGDGVLVKGNLRADRAEVWAKTQEGVERIFKGKYTVFMLEEPDAFPGQEGGGGSASAARDRSGDRGPRVSFLIVPSDKAGPNPDISAWQYFVATALFGLTTASALQLGLVAEVSQLPAATIDWLAQGAAGLDTTLPDGALPPGLEGFNAEGYIAGAFPILGGVWATGLAHEAGHSIAAAARKIKLSVPYLIPNGQLGSFGAITQIKSLPENRSDLFDVAIAGPLAGTVCAFSLFWYGLALSVAGTDGGEAAVGLLPIPPELFNGSLLLGAISEFCLGENGEMSKGVLVHPLFIAGWVSLVTQALNCLPVGQLDGGRITMTGFGRRALGATSLGVYLGLSLGVIGSSLSLPFGLFVLIAQRTPEFSPKDDVTPVSEGRQQMAMAVILVSLLILLPGGDFSQILGTGPDDLLR